MSRRESQRREEAFLLLKPGAGGLTRKKGLLPRKQQSTHNSGLAASTCSAGPLLFLCFCIFSFFYNSLFHCSSCPESRMGFVLYTYHHLQLEVSVERASIHSMRLLYGDAPGLYTWPASFLHTVLFSLLRFFYLATTMPVKFPFSTQVELETWKLSRIFCKPLACCTSPAYFQHLSLVRRRPTTRFSFAD